MFVVAMMRQVSGPDCAGTVSSTPLGLLAHVLFAGSCGSGCCRPLKAMLAEDQMTWVPGR